MSSLPNVAIVSRSASTNQLPTSHRCARSVPAAGWRKCRRRRPRLPHQHVGDDDLGAFLANSRASASPMPWAPPVMIATLSLSRMMSSPSTFWDAIIRWRCAARKTGHRRGAAARRSRSLIASPNSNLGNRHHGDPDSPREPAFSSNFRRPANSRAAASIRSAVSLNQTPRRRPPMAGRRQAAPRRVAHPLRRAAPAASAHSARRAGPAIAVRVTVAVIPNAEQDR